MKRVRNCVMQLKEKLRGIVTALAQKKKVVLRSLANEKGQGTTEYAILVGVLVLIAIVAVIAFKDKISELWNSIAEGINSL